MEQKGASRNTSARTKRNGSDGHVGEMRHVGVGREKVVMQVGGALAEEAG